MKRVLFVVLGEKGHVHPFLGPARELERRGVSVSFFAPTDLSESLGRAGFVSFVGVRGRRPEAESRGAAFAELVRNEVRLAAWIRAMLLDSVPAMVTDLERAVDAAQPDALVIDPMAYAGAIVAGTRGLPWAGLSTSLNPVVVGPARTPLMRTIAELAPARDELFERYGLRAEFRVCDCLSPRFTGCFATPELVGEPPEGIELLGPSLPVGARGDEPAFDWSWLAPGRPLVSMSLGSQIWHQPRMFRAVIEACRGGGSALLLATGDLDLGPLPEGVLAVPYMPQIQALQRSAVFVTHGGANSLMEALASGVPMLVSPICNDQHHNAELLVRAGVALELDLTRAAPSEVAHAIDQLAGTGAVRARVHEVASAYRRVNGAERAAELVVERLLDGSPT